eukprot:gene16913-biopygen4647
MRGNGRQIQRGFTQRAGETQSTNGQATLFRDPAIFAQRHVLPSPLALVSFLDLRPRSNRDRRAGAESRGGGDSVTCIDATFVKVSGGMDATNPAVSGSPGRSAPGGGRHPGAGGKEGCRKGGAGGGMHEGRKGMRAGTLRRRRAYNHLGWRMRAGRSAARRPPLPQPGGLATEAARYADASILARHDGGLCHCLSGADFMFHGGLCQLCFAPWPVRVSQGYVSVLR